MTCYDPTEGLNAPRGLPVRTTVRMGTNNFPYNPLMRPDRGVQRCTCPYGGTQCLEDQCGACRTLGEDQACIGETSALHLDPPPATDEPVGAAVATETPARTPGGSGTAEARTEARGEREARYAEAVVDALVPWLRKVFGEVEDAGQREVAMDVINCIAPLVENGEIAHVIAVADAELAERESGTDPGMTNLEAELVALRRWKAEALEVITGLQDLGKALELPLGERITGPVATEAAKRLRAQVARLSNIEATLVGPIRRIFGDEVADALEVLVRQEIEHALDGA